MAVSTPTETALVGAVMPALVYLGATGTAAAQDSPEQDGRLSVRVGKHATHGRLVLDLPYPLGYRALRSGQDVILRFTRPVAPPVAPAFGTLDAYLAGAWISDDGRALVLRLARDRPVRTFALPNRIVVDIHDPGSPGLSKGAAPAAGNVQVLVPRETVDRQAAAAPTPTQPAQAQRVAAVQRGLAEPPRHSPGTAGRRPANQPPALPIQQPSRRIAAGSPPVFLKLRVGEHGGYTRVVFDWPRGVRYGVEPLPGRIAVHFDQPAEIDADALVRRQPKHIDGVSFRSNEHGSTMLIGVRAGGALRHFPLDNAIVLDVYGAGTPPPATDGNSGVARPLPPGAPIPAQAETAPAAPLSATTADARLAPMGDRPIDVLARELAPTPSLATVSEPVPADPGRALLSSVRQRQELLAQPENVAGQPPQPRDEAFQPLQ